MRGVQSPSPDVLAKLTVFRRVSLADRARLAAAGRLQSFERGEDIFQEGDAPDTLVLVVEGRVKIFKRLGTGRELILHIFGPGDPLGVVAVYEDRPYMASAQALESTVCFLLPQRGFFSLLESSPTLVRGILSSFTMRLIELTERLAELTGTHVEARIAKLFVKLVDQFGQKQADGIFLPMPLTRQELADLTGTTIETCIRTMSRWSKEHLVLTERNGFLVLNPPALRVLADNDA